MTYDGPRCEVCGDPVLYEDLWEVYERNGDLTYQTCEQCAKDEVEKNAPTLGMQAPSR